MVEEILGKAGVPGLRTTKPDLSHNDMIQFMRSISVTILRRRTSSEVFDTLHLADTMERTINSVYQIHTEHGLRAKLKELLSLSDDEIQSIIDSVDGADSKYIQSYTVNEATYKLVFG